MILQNNSSMGADKGSPVQFEDFLPSMVRKLGSEGLIQELCKGFQLLMDPRAGKITFQSLKRNAASLGLGDLQDDELSEMMREGDLDGDGVLDQMEFCILTVGLSPELMEEEAHI
ncbi:calcium-binding protein PBP1-like [Phragmites australis]|uniref:calcium-binding protein PBP1-like n=1 Tax=Phragmites australis TaxID=29695 RepID=UPI002D76803F|nr:calcium-binding protein PBP1-like [Phragmites australis]